MRVHIDNRGTDSRQPGRQGSCLTVGSCRGALLHKAGHGAQLGNHKWVCHSHFHRASPKCGLFQHHYCIENMTAGAAATEIAVILTQGGVGWGMDPSSGCCYQYLNGQRNFQQ